MEKFCPSCKNLKFKSDFNKSSVRLDCLQTYCKICQSKKIKQTKVNNRAKFANKILPENKECFVCKEIKSGILSFGINQTSNDGLRDECKECTSKRSKNITLRHRSEFSIDNVPKNKYCSGCDQIKLSNDFNFEKGRSDGLQVYCKKCLRYKSKISRNKPDSYRNKKRKNDKAYKLRENVSSTIRTYLKINNGFKKGSSTWSKLLYTPQQLKEHLEKQFTPEMNWNNYGSYWNIDHIYPQSKLIYDSLEHPNFLQCWDLSNLRPLKVLENILKSDKIIDDLKI